MTENEFIAAFHKLCDESTLFVPTDKLYPADTNCYFSLELVDESPMLRGLGIVIDSWSIAQNPFKQAGIHVRITQLTTLSEPIFERVLAARPMALHKKGPRTRHAPMTHQQWGSMVEPPTMESLAYDIEEKTATSKADAEETKPAKPITREMRSASVAVVASRTPAPLPPIPSVKPGSGPTRSKEPSVTTSGAPVAELDEKTTETTRYGDHLRQPSVAFAEASPSGPVAAPPRSTAAGSPPPPMTNASTPDHGVGIAAQPPAPIAVTPPPAPTSSPFTSPADLDYPMVDRPPTTWWQLAWWQRQWRSGAWRRLLRIETWRNAWRTWLTAYRTGEWRNAWWANRRVGGVFAGGILMGVLFTVLLRPSRPAKAPALAANVPAQRETASCPKAPESPTVVADASDGAASKRPASTPHGKPATKVAAATPSAKQTHSVATTAKTPPASRVAAAPATTKAAPATKAAPPVVATKSSPAVTTKAAPATTTKAAPPTTTKSVAAAPTARTAPPTTKPTPTTKAVAAASTTKAPATSPMKAPATTKAVAATSTTKTTTKTAAAPATKPATTTTTKAVATAPATKTAPATTKTTPTTPTTTAKAPTTTKPATTKPTNVAAAKSATPAAKRGKSPCSSLDCI